MGHSDKGPVGNNIISMVLRGEVKEIEYNADSMVQCLLIVHDTHSGAQCCQMYMCPLATSYSASPKEPIGTTQPFRSRMVEVWA